MREEKNEHFTIYNYIKYCKINNLKKCNYKSLVKFKNFIKTLEKIK